VDAVGSDPAKFEPTRATFTGRGQKQTWHNPTRPNPANQPEVTTDQEVGLWFGGGVLQGPHPLPKCEQDSRQANRRSPN
jgi:hypothetical protein